MTIDGGDRQSRNDNIIIDPRPQDHSNQHQHDKPRECPCCASLHLDFFAVGEMFSPAKNKRLAITLRLYPASRLLSISLHLSISLIIRPSRGPLCLTFHCIPFLRRGPIVQINKLKYIIAPAPAFARSYMFAHVCSCSHAHLHTTQKHSNSNGNICQGAFFRPLRSPWHLFAFILAVF